MAELQQIASGLGNRGTARMRRNWLIETVKEAQAGSGGAAATAAASGLESEDREWAGESEPPATVAGPEIVPLPAPAAAGGTAVVQDTSTLQGSSGSDGVVQLQLGEGTTRSPWSGRGPWRPGGARHCKNVAGVDTHTDSTSDWPDHPCGPGRGRRHDEAGAPVPDRPVLPLPDVPDDRSVPSGGRSIHSVGGGHSSVVPST